MREYIISDNEAGQRFDKYLAKLFKNAPSGLIFKQLRGKNITLNKAKAKGLYISFPLPLLKAIGKSPNIVVKEVIKTGRNLLGPAIIAASSPFIFFSCIN